MPTHATNWPLLDDVFRHNHHPGPLTFSVLPPGGYISVLIVGATLILANVPFCRHHHHPECRSRAPTKGSIAEVPPPYKTPIASWPVAELASSPRRSLSPLRLIDSFTLTDVLQGSFPRAVGYRHYGCWCASAQWYVSQTLRVASSSSS
ncbi:hypothetical protein FKP32DRAFT_92371 [Trametes sanguinea]|nr:hypothetical protein FKP32DRAFT_92371 [Trametes sanguinea]